MGSKELKQKKTGSYCRTRGHSFEREVAILFRELYPKARRGLQYQDGEFAADVEGTTFRIECSRGHSQNIKVKWVQVLGDAKKANDKRCCLVVKKWDRMDAVVTLKLEDFLNILRSDLRQANRG